MDIPLEITFREIPHDQAVEDEIRERSGKLYHLYPRILFFRFVVEAPHRSHHKGNLYHLRVHLGVPGEDLHVNRDPQDNHAHEDVHIAVRDAFQAAHRQLLDYLDRRRGYTKSH
ncbi:MAG: ribosome-associated translation inhibitor RaiA [Planctomycetota bacterium]|nr:MAG: ribosome-associated translation inhibitor RaiA [Planctomycetota bacterium]